MIGIITLIGTANICTLVAGMYGYSRTSCGDGRTREEIRKDREANEERERSIEQDRFVEGLSYEEKRILDRALCGKQEYEPLWTRIHETLLSHEERVSLLEKELDASDLDGLSESTISKLLFG